MDQIPSMEYILKLPITSVQIGNETKRVRYDSQAKRVYRLDDNDNWNGEYAELDLDSFLNPPQPEQSTQEESNPFAIFTAPQESVDVNATPLSVNIPTLEPFTAAPPPTDPFAADSTPANPFSAEAASSDPFASDIFSGVLSPVEAPSQDAPLWSSPTQSTPTPEQSNNLEQPNTALEDFAPQLSSLDAPSSEKKSPVEKGKNTSRTWIWLLVGLAALTVAIWIIAIIAMSNSSNNQNTPSTGADTVQEQQTEANDEINTTLSSEPSDGTTPSETEPVQTQPTETQPAVVDVYVLCPVETMIPGQVITETTMTSVGITDAEYRQISASVGLYTEDDWKNIIGLVAADYIPAGAYLTYDDVCRAYSPLNPWISEMADSVAITLPVVPTADDLSFYSWGTSIDLTITVQTKQTNENTTAGDGEAPPEGLEHESSVVESMVLDTYKLQGVCIKDLLDAQQQSLFAKYMSFTMIPAGFQRQYLESHYSDITKIQTDLPCYITIVVSQEQADVLTQLDTASMKVTVSNPVPNNSSTLQNDTYVEIQGVTGIIAEIWKTFPGGEIDAASE